jgi:hypothetical protein
MFRNKIPEALNLLTLSSTSQRGCECGGYVPDAGEVSERRASLPSDYPLVQKD